MLKISVCTTKKIRIDVRTKNHEFSICKTIEILKQSIHKCLFWIINNIEEQNH